MFGELGKGRGEGAHLVPDDVAVELVGRDEPQAVVVKGFADFGAVDAPAGTFGLGFEDPLDVAVHEVEALLGQDRLAQGDGDDGEGDGAHCGGGWGDGFGRSVSWVLVLMD